jgi:non-homologous end joining protein Ku
MLGLCKRVEKNYQVLKSGVKNNTLTIDEIDHMTCELITFLSMLTEQRITHINADETVDRYKERVWNIVENAGLLPEL